MFDDMCDLCGDNKIAHKVKACCSHLVGMCDDCSHQRKVVMHEKCAKCSGRLTPSEQAAADAAALDVLKYGTEDYIDDSYDDLDYPSPRDIYPTGNEYNPEDFADQTFPLDDE